MKIILLTEFFEHREVERRAELLECLMLNIQNPDISEIWLLAEEQLMLPEHISLFSKVKKIAVDGRALFSHFFAAINSYHEKDTIYIVANLDIYFDETLRKLSKLDWNDLFVCLSRWNLEGYCGTPGGKPLLNNKLQLNPADSHDCWITSGQVKEDLVRSSMFSMGIPGCDGKLCYLMQQSGYRTINPCEDIISYHKHLTGGYLGHRTYSERERIRAPYGKVPATKL